MAELDTLTMPPAYVGAADETDEQRLQRLAGQMRPDLMPPAGTPRQPAPASMAMMPPAGVPMAVSAQPANVMPPAGVPTAAKAPAQPANVMPPVPRLGTPMPGSLQPESSSDGPAGFMPPAQVPIPKSTVNVEATPAQPPRLTGWKGVLDKIGSLFPIGKAIEERIPGTPQNFDAEQAKQFARAMSEADIRQKSALASQEESKARTLENPPAKAVQPPLHATPGEGIYNEATGKWDIPVPAKPEKEEAAPKVTPGEGIFNKDTGKWEVPVPAKPATQNFEEQDYEEWKAAQKPGADTSRMAFEKARAAATQKPPQPQRELAVTPDGRVVEVTPGMNLEAGTVPLTQLQGQQTQGMKPVTWTDASGRQVAGPESAAKAAGATDLTEMPPQEWRDVQNARFYVQMATKQGDPNKPETMGTLQLVDSLDKDGKLGVLASRWNRLSVRGIGADPGDDPRIVTLLNKADLQDTLAMLAHFGASGGRSPQMLQHFLDMANAGKMDGLTLKSGIKAVTDYMKDRAMMPAAAQGGGGHAFTVNGKQYAGVSDQDYQKAKKLPGFKE